MDKISVDVDSVEFRLAMARFQVATKASLEDCITFAAKSGMTRVIQYTPPGGRGVTGGKAKKALENRILSDYLGIMQPVKLKKKRPEEHPNLQSLLRAHPGFLRSNVFQRPQRYPRAYVSASKFTKEYTRAKKRVGRAAAGWLRAAQYLNIKPQAWISRHGPNLGAVRAYGSDKTYTIEAENFSFKGKNRQYEALLVFAVSAGINNLERHASRILKARLKKAGLAA